MNVVRIAALCVALSAVGFVGCSHVEVPGRGKPESAYRVAEGVDPAIFQDILDTAAPLPGARGQRTMAVSAQLDGLLAQKCYGKRSVFEGDPDGRYDQSRFADLDLILREGFAEELIESEDGLGLPEEETVEVEPECWREEVPHYVVANDLLLDWLNGYLGDAHNDSSMKDVKRDVAECLREKSELDPSDEDPTTTFLVQYDGLMIDRLGAAGEGREAVDAAYDAVVAEYSPIFVECARPYYEALASNLEPKRSEFVEKNREVLEAAAQELAALGYVP